MNAELLAQQEALAQLRISPVEVSLPTQTPPKSADTLLHGQLPTNQLPIVLFTQTALRQARAHAESNTYVELGGVLLGHAYQNNHKVYVQVEAALPAQSKDKGPIHFKFTGDAWAQLHLDREAVYPELAIVGWFHTHPDLGVFFSADDEVVQRAAFTQPWHVGLVIDPVRRQTNLFGWQMEQIVPINGFYEWIPPTAGGANEVPRTVINWAVTIDDGWVYPPVSPSASLPSLEGVHGLPPITPWVGVFLGGLGFLFGLAALIIVLWRT